MTFGDYLRTRRSFTEAGLALRQAVAGMPVELHDSAEVHAWLCEQGASKLVREAAYAAVYSYRGLLNRRRATAAKQAGRSD